MGERAMRVGIGYDVHAFAPPEAGRPLMIGGVAIPHDRGLAGHSDADVLLHAVVDALLGAAALGDIGTYFPSSDVRWQGASSADFLAHTGALLAKAGWRIENVDTTVVMEAPRLGPHVAALGLTFSSGQTLGPAFARGAFVGEHGSWDRIPQSGYKVVFVPFTGTQPSGMPIDVLTGFTSGGKAFGRPVGVQIARDGSLLVADDVGNSVWRVSAVR